jgi:hypothetical protein
MALHHTLDIGMKDIDFAYMMTPRLRGLVLFWLNV